MSTIVPTVQLNIDNPLLIHIKLNDSLLFLDWFLFWFLGQYVDIGGNSLLLVRLVLASVFCKNKKWKILQKNRTTEGIIHTYHYHSVVIYLKKYTHTHSLTHSLTHPSSSSRLHLWASCSFAWWIDSSTPWRAGDPSPGTSGSLVGRSSYRDVGDKHYMSKWVSKSKYN
jgi:hypothetical protein